MNDIAYKENNKKAAKAFLRRQRKKKSKMRRKQEEVEYQMKVEEEEDSETPSSLTDIEEFELKGGFSRFAMHFDSDPEEDEKSVVSSVPKVVSQLIGQSINELPLKARAAAILQEENEKDDLDEPKMGKKKMKLLNRMSTAQLKINVERPELVETWDYCSPDPLILLELKAMRNTVPVPRHWCAKRKYLQGKRGFEKTPFQLPEFIVKTGVIEMRQSVQEKETDKSLKAKMREKIRPKVGHVDIDYNKLHDAFFKEQVKPPMTIHGDIYYEGKEFEVKLREKKPGQLSDELRTGLGLPTGPNADKYPPPWLIAMQRYGPPPSYPNLRIPGLNAPIPFGCSFGYHANGWGKPPVDETGRPIYGDVFQDSANIPQLIPPPPPSDDPSVTGIGEGNASNRQHWGEIDSEDEEEDEDGGDEDDDENMDQSDDEDRGVAGIATPHGMISETSLPGMFTPGLVTPGGGTVTRISGISLAPPPPPGLLTPQNIELRKKPSETAQPGSLFQVLPQIKTEVGEALVGTTKLYQIPEPIGAQQASADKVRKRKLGSSSHTPAVGSEDLSGGIKSEETLEQTKHKKHKDFKF